MKQLDDSNPSRMVGAGRSNALYDYGFALQSYRQFIKAYSTAACPTLNWELSVYEDELVAANKAQTECWKCGEKYHPRYRVIRANCKHYVCSRCEMCYCMSPQSRRRRNRGVVPAYKPASWMGF